MRWSVAVLVAVACRAPGGEAHERDGGDADADADTDTDTDTGPPEVTATCAVQPDNALRADCTVAVSPPGPVAVAFVATGGGPERTASSPQALAAHAVTLWRMFAETTYAYTVTATETGVVVQGTFTTGALPDAVDLGVTLSGASTAVEDVLLLLGCDGPHAVAIAPDGRPVWYQPLAADLPGVPAVQALVFTPDREVAVIVDQARVRRFGLDGRLAFDVAPDLGKPLHHDLFVRDGRTFVLDASTWSGAGGTYVVDGVAVLDPTGQVLGEWELADVVAPFGPNTGGTYWEPVFPGAIDWSHGNGLFVDEASDALVSFYHLDTVVQVALDPDHADFGTTRWVLNGSGYPFPPSDFALVDPDGLTTELTFHAHHPTLLPSGELQLFDNGSVDARVLRLALDLPGGQAAVTGSWPLGATCAIGGAAFELSNGHLLATCTTAPAVYELDPVTGTIGRTIVPVCADGFPRPFPRAIPVTL